MKKNIFRMLALSAAFTMAMNSCTVEIHEDADDPASGIGTAPTNTTVLEGTGNLSGTITKDLLIKKGNYTLEGLVKITEGVKLTIEPGAKFTVKTNVASGLIILKGAKAYIDGSSTEPIVFTTNEKVSSTTNSDRMSNEIVLKS